MAAGSAVPSSTGTSAPADPDAVPGSPQPRGFVAAFILAWFGIGIATSTISGASIPAFFTVLDESSKTTNQSLNSAIGGVVVIVITPLFGRLSDRTMSHLGIRRPWILGGAIVGLGGVAILALAQSVWMVIAGWAVVQIGFGAANAAVHALLADQIPKRIRARVSGAVSASSAVALIVGAQLVALLPIDQPWLWFVVPGVIGALLMVWLFFALHDIVRTTRPDPWRWSDILSTYWVNPIRHPDFFWAFCCRILVTSSIFSVSLYLLFFIVDHLEVPIEQARQVQANTLVIFALGNIILTILFGWVSDKTGRRKPIVWVSCFLTTVGLTIAIASPDLTTFYVGICLVGAAQGAYVAVDVALMTEVLPSFASAGKDMGIVALSYQTPQVIVPILALPVLSIGGSGDNYTALFIAAILCSLAGGLAVLPIKGVR